MPLIRRSNFWRMPRNCCKNWNRIMLDVDANSLENIKQILAEHVPDCEVIAFGSRVTGNAKPYSDLDIAVQGADKIDLTRLNRLEEAFEFSDLPFRVDVVDWHGISDSFRKIIEGQKEVIQDCIIESPKDAESHR